MNADARPLDHDSGKDGLGNVGDAGSPIQKAAPIAGQSSIETLASPTTTLPTRIGQFHIKSVVASGGMGTVYEAVQDHPRRTVAVKVLKRGIASPSAMRRFEYESQTLARLRHPGIAQVYEAGTYDDGAGVVPYFAMEYIPHALPITTYAKGKALTTRQKLELFARVCDAVHHGHQKGIIHRDLKPGNILVDSHGDVKVIDFGVARGTDSDMAVTTLQTDIGQLIGTLQYMSPEQCVADPHDIDTRSDVYALGVVLYELLSGRLPYDVTKKAVLESTRMIREEQPTRLSTVDVTLRGDTETIVFKALEKDRERRYQSAIELAQDIRRHLAGEAIVARPPSIVYQLRVFARRNKAFFTAVAAAFVVLVGGVIVSTSLYVRAERQRERAVIAEQDQSRERARAEAARIESEHAKAAAVEERERAEANEARASAAGEQAKREAEKATLVLEALQKWLVESVHPGEPEHAELTVREMVDEAANKIDAQYADQPEIRATLLLTVGRLYSQTYVRDRAEQILSEALEVRRRLFGDASLEVAEVFMALCEMPMREREHKEQALQYCRKAVAIRQKLLHQDHPLLAEARLREVTLAADPSDRLHGLAEYHRFLLPLLFSQLNPDEFPKEICDGLVKARELWEAGDQERAITTMWQSVDKGIARVQTLWASGEHEPARELVRAGYKPLLAHPVFRPWVAPGIITFSENPWWTEQKRDFDAREPLLHEAVAVAREMGGDDSKELPGALLMLGQLLIQRNRYGEAEGLLAEALRICRKQVGVEHPTAPAALSLLGQALHGQGKFTEAETLCRETLEIWRRVLGEEHPNTLASMSNLASALYRQGRYAEAEEFYRNTLEIRRRMLGEHDPGTIVSMASLGTVLSKQGKHSESLELYRRVLEFRRMRAESAEATTAALNAYAWFLLTCEVAELRDAEKALPFAVRAVEMTNGQDSNVLDTLARAYQMTGDIDRAVETQQKALAFLPADRTLDRMVFEGRLGEYLTEQRSYAEAEPLLLNAYQALSEREYADPDVRKEFIGRIVKLYESWDAAEPGKGYAEKAAEYRAK